MCRCSLILGLPITENRVAEKMSDTHGCPKHVKTIPALSKCTSKGDVIKVSPNQLGKRMASFKCDSMLDKDAALFKI